MLAIVSIPAAVTAHIKQLPTELQQQIQALAGPRPGRYTLMLVSTWLQILTAITLAQHVDHWALTLLTVIFVATRQNVLALLVHDQAHMLGYRVKRWGDLAVNLFAAWPLLVLSTEKYAQVHLAHHQHFFRPELDPDFVRKAGDDWTFPMPKSRLIRLFARDLSGLSVLQFLRGKQRSFGTPTARQKAIPRCLQPLWLAAAAGLITLLHGWPVVLLYWVVPLFSVFMAIVRWGAMCEHVYGAADACAMETTPLILPKWWQRLLLPNLNFSLHIYHHMNQNIAWCELPKVHALFVKAGQVNPQAVFDGFGDYWQRVVAAPH